MNQSEDNKIESIDKKIKEKEKAEQIVKDYLKPSCDEEITENEYPTLKE
jgi:hypothetical protein|tara:strand:- start:344 stop:490 length:147 start_codon:yes stop_codon:yes gene_type:complete